MTGYPGVKEAHILGRVYTDNPRQGECFYLQLLCITSKEHNLLLT